MDYYSRLGVSPSASTAEITRAFRSLAMKYHPDRNRDPGAAQSFIAIREAFEILSILERRAVYDRVRGPGTAVVARSQPDDDAGEYERWRSHARERAQRESEMPYEEFLQKLKELAAKVGEGASVVTFVGLLAVGGGLFGFLGIGLGLHLRGSDGGLAFLLLGGCSVVCFWAAGAAVKDVLAERNK